MKQYDRGPLSEFKHPPHFPLCLQMDAVNRSCMVSAHCGSHQVHLVVKFPAQYPNNAAPSFLFVPPTTIPSAMKTKIQKVQTLLNAPQQTQQHRQDFFPVFKSMQK